jgi:hypothetical protein
MAGAEEVFREISRVFNPNGGSGNDVKISCPLKDEVFVGFDDLGYCCVTRCVSRSVGTMWCSYFV